MTSLQTIGLMPNAKAIFKAIFKAKAAIAAAVSRAGNGARKRKAQDARNAPSRNAPREKKGPRVPREELLTEVRLPYHRRQRILQRMLYEGIASEVRLVITEKFMVPFALVLSAPLWMIAAISTLPQLVSSLVQTALQRVLAFFREKRRVLLLGSLLQALSWIPIIVLPFISKRFLVLILIFVTLEQVFAKFKDPVFNDLLSDMVGPDQRGVFFGRRGQVIGMVSLAVTILAGSLLSFFHTRNELLGFSLLFTMAFMARIACYRLQRSFPKVAVTKDSVKSQEAKSQQAKSKHANSQHVKGQHAERFIDFVRSMRRQNYGFFVYYASFMKLAVTISSPFFAVYMLRDLQFDYLTFTLVSSASVVSAFLFTTYWGRRIDAFGTKSVLRSAGLLVPAIPALWLVSSNPVYLFIVEFSSGIIWSGFNLASSNFVYDAATPKQKIPFIVYYNTLIGIAVFAGAMLGAGMSWLMTESHITLGYASSLPVLFLVSAVLRAAASLRLLGRIQEARLVSIPLGQAAARATVLMRPSTGAVFYRHVTPRPARRKQSVEREKEREKERRQGKTGRRSIRRSTSMRPKAERLITPEDHDEYKRHNLELMKREIRRTMEQQEKKQERKS